MSAAAVTAAPPIAFRPNGGGFGRRFGEAAFGLLLSVLQFSAAATFVATALAATSSGSQPPKLSNVVGGTLLILVPTLVFSLFFATVLGLPASLALAQLDRLRIGLVGRVAVHFAAGWLIGGVVLALLEIPLQWDITESVAGGGTVPALVPSLLITAVLANAFGIAAGFGALASRLTFDYRASRRAALA